MTEITTKFQYCKARVNNFHFSKKNVKKNGFLRAIQKLCLFCIVYALNLN